jgi:hypothetical protein
MNTSLQPKPKAAPMPSITSARAGLTMQRKCACGGSSAETGDCEACKSKRRLTLQRYSANRAKPSALLRSLAAPSHTDTRPAIAPGFGHSFAQLQVHTRGPRGIQAKLNVSQPGDQSEQEADRIAEQVMRTSAPSSAPSSTEGHPRSTALSHTPLLIQRQAADEMATTPEAAPATAPGAAETAATAEATTAGLIVEDEAQEVGPDQMRKSEFLDELRAAVCAAADAELAAVGRSTESCPYIERAFERYRTMSGGQLERRLRRYAPETAGARTARDYIPAVSERVRRAVAVWARTGQITGVPEELASQLPGGGLLGVVGGVFSGVAGAVSGVVGGLGRALGGIFTKAREGGAKEVGEPQEIQSQLGSGQSLDGGVRSRMESAFGYDFSHVRVHVDGKAAELSNNLNARAFTIGSDIAFAAGEYQPGSLIGDALLAHELAHVVQQGGAISSAAPLQMGGTEYSALEEDADVSAVGAVVSTWGGIKGALVNVAQNAMPRLKSGLKLQRCPASTTAARGRTTTTAPTATPSPRAGTGATPPPSGTPCPTSVTVGAIAQRNHSDLSTANKEQFRTELGAMSRMDVGPGPDHSGHCMKERLTVISNNCPATWSDGTPNQPCTGDRCLDINAHSSMWGLTGGPTSFFDMHRTRARFSVLEGTGVSACTIVCEQTYSCDRTHPTTGVFRITRNFQASTFTMANGTTIHITTGNVTKT